ncbi:chorion peroxidase [Anastrepha ludens]|uniref:chorion peroxidase n=1 Tax=Anastrepha ludens TaxID=28586 RepID=UPI0023B1F7C9|nr:chorion peroxidase [Anastrepha ludens]
MRSLKCFMLTFLVYFTVCSMNCGIHGFSVAKIKREAATPEAAHDTAHPVDTPAFTTADVGVEEDDETNTNWDWQTSANGTTEKCESGDLNECSACPNNVACVAKIQCPAHVRMKDHEKPQICDLPDGSSGYCCVTGQDHIGKRPRIERTHFVEFMPISVMEETRQRFHHLMHNIAMQPVARGKPEFLHGISFHSSALDDKENFHLSNSAMQQVIAAQLLSSKEEIPVDDLITNSVLVDYKETPLAQHCLGPRLCSNFNARYRNFDGTCNNRLPGRTHWGAAGQPMERLLPPAYEDGLWTPRMHSVDGSELMYAREVSRRLLTESDRPHPRYNLMLMQFGQFLAHDVSQSASVRLENGELVECCTPNGGHALPPHKRHFACMPITVAEDDEFYSTFNIRCMNFVRLSLAPNIDCKLSYGKQRSKVTHFIDASPVYGSSEETARELREFNGGRLRMSKEFGRELLPLTSDKGSCDSHDESKICYKSGDGRTNQIISLVILQTLMAREHNRIAGILARLNPRLNDELLFHEARRIVIAELQHITYKEYLPAIIGRRHMKRFRLMPQRHGYGRGYNPNVNPATTNEFSGAAFRMGHSTVDGKLYMHLQDYKVAEIINIPDVMFNPSRMRIRSFMDDMIRTMFAQPMQMVDSFITHGLSRYLFRGHHPFGLDLAAINIQRGRDHALPSYNNYLLVMGHSKVHSFNDLPEEIGQKLAEIYRHPDDIDLWVGGLLEDSIRDGIVGNTFAELIADQFTRYRQGDRYFYEYGKDVNPGAFTVAQLNEIRKASMARLICDNADHLTLNEVPPAAFVRADFALNTPVRCDSDQIPVVDLTAWRWE